MAVPAIKRVCPYPILSHRPVTRLSFDEDGRNLYSSSYDKSIKRLDIASRKVETLFKLDKYFSSDVFIHHFIPYPDQPSAFLVSLGNGYQTREDVIRSEVITVDTRSGAIESCFQAHPKKVNTVLAVRAVESRSTCIRINGTSLPPLWLGRFAFGTFVCSLRPTTPISTT